MSAELAGNVGKWNCFHFGYLDYDLDLQREANLRLMKLIGYAPPGAIGMGWVEKVESRFYAKVIIRSSFRTFEATSSRNDPRLAISRTLEKIEEEIFKWRFGGGSGTNGGEHFFSRKERSLGNGLRFWRWNSG